jgi:hypothetical protein
MALENWIDELVRDSEITFNGKPVRGFRLYEKSEFPASLTLDNIPCALTFVRRVDCQYGTGPCFDIFTGSIEYHLTKNTNRDQLPEVLHSIRRIRDTFALHRTLGGKVAYCALEVENSVVGPVKLQYGSEEEHLGLVANWWVKENTSGEITLGN